MDSFESMLYGILARLGGYQGERIGKRKGDN